MRDLISRKVPSLNILVHDVIDVLYYEHWTEKQKWFYIKYIKFGCLQFKNKFLKNHNSVAKKIPLSAAIMDSVNCIEWGFDRWFQNLKPYDCQKTVMKSCATLDDEYLLATSLRK